VPCTSYVQRQFVERGGLAHADHGADGAARVSVQPFGWTGAVTAVAMLLRLGCVAFMLAMTARAN